MKLFLFSSGQSAWLYYLYLFVNANEQKTKLQQFLACKPKTLYKITWCFRPINPKSMVSAISPVQKSEIECKTVKFKMIDSSDKTELGQTKWQTDCSSLTTLEYKDFITRKILME